MLRVALSTRVLVCPGGTVVQLGACDDHQTAADTVKLSATAYTGAATYTFIQAIERYGPDQSYSSLLVHMTEALRALGKSSVSNPSAAGTAVAAGLPVVLGLALGPLGLLAGAQLGAVAGKAQRGGLGGWGNGACHMRTGPVCVVRDDAC